ncbi:MAG: hypothetical protein RIC19_14565 [Phaeodactylibacter sp.]|uniref:hypothetical protein n=1 Tax=Phaeodactylibacter sp. TaxID=1940289 RepID=UPI0032F09993
MNKEFIHAKIERLETELKPYLPTIGQAADTILDQDVSSYPIFIIHQMDSVDIGIPLLSHEAEDGPPWSVNASTLEELATKKVVEMAKVDAFRQVYKDPRENLCLFVLSDLGANFMFISR